MLISAKTKILFCLLPLIIPCLNTNYSNLLCTRCKNESTILNHSRQMLLKTLWLFGLSWSVVCLVFVWGNSRLGLAAGQNYDNVNCEKFSDYKIPAAMFILDIHTSTINTHTAQRCSKSGSLKGNVGDKMFLPPSQPMAMECNFERKTSFRRITLIRLRSHWIIYGSGSLSGG